MEIKGIHKQSRETYGAPRVQIELRDRGQRHGRNRIGRLMREQGLCGRRKKRYRVQTTDSQHDEPIAPNRLAEAPVPTRPDQLWAADITYVATAAGWVYVAAILDLYSRRIVGWVVTVPEGAAVMFDGKTVSKPTAVEIPVPDARLPHTVDVQLKNYKPFKRNIVFTEGEGRIQVLAVLTPIFGKLDIRSNPPEADIYIDNTHRGRTPATIDNLIPTGDNNHELRKRGFRPVTEVIKWEGQTYLTREITLKRASP